MFSKINYFIPKICGIGLISFTFNTVYAEEKHKIDIDKTNKYKKDLIRKCIVDDNRISGKRECEPIVKLADSIELFERCKASNVNSKDDNCIEKFIYHLSIDRVRYSKATDAINRDLIILTSVFFASKHLEDYVSKMMSNSTRKESLISKRVNNEIADKMDMFNKCLNRNKNEVDNTCLEKMFYDMSSIRLQNPQYYGQIMNIMSNFIDEYIVSNEGLNETRHNVRSEGTMV